LENFMAGARLGRFVLMFIVAAALGGAGCASPEEETPVPAPITSTPAAAAMPPAADAPLATGGATQDEIAPTASAVPASTDSDTPAAQEEAISIPPDGIAPPPTIAPRPLAPGAVLDAYQVRSSFTVTSTLADGSARRRQVTTAGYTVDTAGTWGFDAVYTVTYATDVGQETLVYVLQGEYVALRTGGRWLTAARRPEQRVGDPNGLLDMPFLAGLGQGTPLGEEPVNGVAARRYRVDDVQRFRALLGDGLAVNAGEPVRVTLDGWLAPEGYVLRYELDVDVSNAAFLDESGTETPAQQQVRIVFDVVPLSAPPAVEWPADAPAPGAVAVPGFELGEFPIPADAEARVSLEMIEILTSLGVTEALGFYRDELAKMGWSIAGEYTVYSATNGEHALNLLFLPGEDGGTRIQVLTTGQ
jgi:hypothetical protein